MLSVDADRFSEDKVLGPRTAPGSWTVFEDTHGAPLLKGQQTTEESSGFMLGRCTFRPLLPHALPVLMVPLKGKGLSGLLTVSPREVTLPKVV